MHEMTQEHGEIVVVVVLDIIEYKSVDSKITLQKYVLCYRSLWWLFKMTVRRGKISDIMHVLDYDQIYKILDITSVISMLGTTYHNYSIRCNLAGNMHLLQYLIWPKMAVL